MLFDMISYILQALSSRSKPFQGLKHFKKILISNQPRLPSPWFDNVETLAPIGSQVS